jgi:dihydrolipoamide dehydrogenase
VARITVSLMLGQNALRDEADRPILYCINPPAPCLRGFAEAAGLRIRAVDYDLGAIAGSSLHSEGYQGHARMVVDEDRKVIVGFTLVGPDVAEMVHAATIAIVGEVPLNRLWHAVPAFPTVSEVWLRLLEAYGR